MCMFILTHQSHPDSRGEFDGFSKNKIKYFFHQANSAKFSHDGRGWDHVSVFKKIALLQRKKFVRNCKIPSISPRLTVLSRLGLGLVKS